MAIRLGTAPPPVNAEVQIDLCDRCGIRARVHAVLRSGGELYFCSHHARENRRALDEVSALLEIIPL